MANVARHPVFRKDIREIHINYYYYNYDKHTEYILCRSVKENHFVEYLLKYRYDLRKQQLCQNAGNSICKIWDDSKDTMVVYNVIQVVSSGSYARTLWATWLKWQFNCSHRFVFSYNFTVEFILLIFSGKAVSFTLTNSLTYIFPDIEMLSTLIPFHRHSPIPSIHTCMYIHTHIHTHMPSSW